MAIRTDTETIQKICLGLGAGALVASVIMKFEFGIAMSLGHAVMLCILAAAVAFMPAYVDHLWRTGARAAAIGLGAIVGMMAIVDFGTDLGYTVGTRVSDSEMAHVQNTAYELRQKQVADEQTNLAMWREQLGKLQAANAWVTTTTADALRKQLDVLQKEIDLEAARGGCKAKCAQRMKDKADAEAKIAVLEEKVDLSKRIEATQKILDGKVDVGTKTEFKSSKLVNQTRFVGQLWSGKLDAGRDTQTWAQYAAALMIALGAFLLPPSCFFVAFRDRKAAAAGSPRASEVGLAMTMAPPDRTPVRIVAGTDSHSRKIGGGSAMDALIAARTAA